MRTFNRKFGVGFMKKSMNITNIGGVMNNNILTKIVIACLCMWSLGLAAESVKINKKQLKENQAQVTAELTKLKAEQLRADAIQQQIADQKAAEMGAKGEPTLIRIGIELSSEVIEAKKALARQIDAEKAGDNEVVILALENKPSSDKVHPNQEKIDYYQQLHEAHANNFNGPTLWSEIEVAPQGGSRDGSVSATITSTDSWNSEVYWILLNTSNWYSYGDCGWCTGVEAFGTTEFSATVPAGNYVFILADSYGDGGATADVSVNGDYVGTVATASGDALSPYSGLYEAGLGFDVTDAATGGNPTVNFEIDTPDDCAWVGLTGTWDGWSGWGLNYGDGTTSLELADGNYEFVILCAQGDGWWYDIWASSIVYYAPIDGSCWNGNVDYPNYAFTVAGEDMTVAVCGNSCDATCASESTCTDYTLSVGGGSWDSEITWDLSDGSSGGAGSFSLCLEDGDYTFNGYDSYGDGWNGGSWTLSDADGNTIAGGAVEGSSGSWDFSTGGAPPVAGCTDANAPNYNADAEVDDGSCEAYCFDGSGCGGYIDYGYDCATLEGYGYDCSACEAEGYCPTVSDCQAAGGNDGYLGDGWCDGVNNQEACGYDAGDCCPGDCVSTTYDCATYGGDCDDCADPGSADLAEGGQCADTPPDTTCDACEFDFTPYGAECCDAALVDFGYNCAEMESGFYWDCSGCACTADECTSDADCTSGQTCEGYSCVDPAPECEATECTLTMNDAYGDGWNGNTWSSGDQSAGLTSGSTGTADFCFDMSVANVYSCGGGSWQSEVSWTLECSDGTSAAGGAPDDGCLGNCDSVVYGCTDAGAPEYNPDATDDDGSCWSDCPYPNWMADGWCDGANNIAECNYDAGDCCPGDCVSATYDCATYGGDCEDCADPNSADNAEGGECYEFVSTCTDDEFDCNGDGTECIPGSYYCDGSIEFCNAGWPADCANGADEGLDVCGYEDECDTEPWDAEVTGLTAEPADFDGIAAVNWDWDDLDDGVGFSCDDGDVLIDCADVEFCNSDCVGASYDGCVTGDSTWIGDGYCDDGTWGLVLACAEYNCDGCDCNAGGFDTDGCNADCEDAVLEDCLNSFSVTGSTDLDGDGYADECYTDGSAYFYFNWEGGCLATGLAGADGEVMDLTDYGFTSGFYYSGWEANYSEYWTMYFGDASASGDAQAGDCAADDGGGEDCADGTLDDCSGDGDCGTEGWVGDGYCDGVAEQYGVNFCCYDLDGGDCTEEECTESGDDGGDDGDPEGCLYDWTAYGAADCDAAWDAYALDCATLEATYGWDCAGCECPGDVADDGGAGCADGQFDCGDGQCIPGSYYCDGSSEFCNAGWGADCANGADEGLDICGYEDECAPSDDGGDDGGACDGLTVSMVDAYGDGWNGNVLTIGDESFTLDSGAAGEGCYTGGMDVAVTCGGGSWGSEVSWSISDAAGVLLAGGAPFEGCLGECPAADDGGGADPNCTLYMVDAYGDGWNGNTWTSGDASATLEDGSEGSADFYFDLSAANSYECGGGSWGSEVSWSLVCDGSEVTEGGAPDSGCFGDCGARDASSTRIVGISTNKFHNLKALAIARENAGKELRIDVPATFNIATGEFTPGTTIHGSRSVSFTLNISCATCLSGGPYEGTFDAGADSEMLIYGFDDGSNVCGNVVATSTEFGSTNPSGDACADAGIGCDVFDCVGTEACGYESWQGDGYCDDGAFGIDFMCEDWNFDDGDCGPACNPGDVNSDGDINVLDIVAIVNHILEFTPIECADYNGDGDINVLDIVAIVNFILEGRTVDATEASLVKDGNALNLNADGYIGGVQMTLSHGADFSITLTDKAMVADYRTNGNETTLIVVAPESNELFTAEGEYEIVEMIVANSQGRMDVAIVPTSFTLSAAYPNPFNPTTTINLSIPEAGHVSVQVYNVMGQLVSTLANGYMDASDYSFTWDASSISSGVYLITATTADNAATQKVMLLK